MSVMVYFKFFEKTPKWVLSVCMSVAVAALLFFAGCEDDSPPVCGVSKATEAERLDPRASCGDTAALAEQEFVITYEIDWSAAANGVAPPNETTTEIPPIIGIVHNKDYTPWDVGVTVPAHPSPDEATAGIELIAEGGMPTVLETEAMMERTDNASVAAGADGIFILHDIDQKRNTTTGSVQFTRTQNITATRDHTELTITHMIAPSPDWFSGTSRASLVNADCTWKDTFTVPVRVYDAGTQQDVAPFQFGAQFGGTLNLEQTPHVPISLLCGGGIIGFDEGQNNHIIGTLTVTKQ